MIGADIRPARAGDEAEIARLAGELGYPSTAEEVAARLLALARERSFVAVAAGPTGPTGPTGNGGLLGWVAADQRVTLDADERAELTGLVVGSGARGTGVGRALVEAAERWALGRGLELMTVRSNVLRPESHPFYTRLGYALTKTQHCYRKQLSRSTAERG